MPQLPFALPAQSAMRREDFLSLPHNQEALGWIERWPDWPSYGLVIWGDQGSGKSHLAHIWQNISDAVFSNWAVPENSNPPVLILEDIDAKLKSNEETLFHILNAVKNNGGYCLLTARRPISRLDISLPDLRSRLLALPQAEIRHPDEEGVKALLHKLFADRQLQVSPEAIDYAALRLVRQYAAVLEFVEQVDRISLASKRNITISLMRDILPQIQHPSES